MTMQKTLASLVPLLECVLHGEGPQLFHASVSSTYSTREKNNSSLLVDTAGEGEGRAN